MRFKDYYAILGVAPAASEDEIKRAFRKLARQFHPDVNKAADAEAKFKEANEAYEVLGDKDKRAAYDRLRARGFRNDQEFQPPPDWAYAGGDEAAGGADGGFAGFGDAGDAADFSEFFASLFGGAARGSRGGARGRPRSGRGDDLHHRIAISLEEAYAGGSRDLVLEQPELSAEGAVLTRRRSLSVRIPAGVADGEQIRLRGQGAPAFGGGEPGDLYLAIAIQPHPRFRVQGRDVHAALAVAPWEAALGGAVAAPTLGGPVELRIPAGAAAGQKLRLRGRGLPGSPPGDQIVELRIVVPTRHDERAQRLWRELGAAYPSFDPRGEGT